MAFNVNDALDQLRGELSRINQAIACFEAIAITENQPRSDWSSRGRKSMGVEERREVSERMKRYWGEQRRAREAQSAKRGSPSAAADRASALVMASDRTSLRKEFAVVQSSGHTGRLAGHTGHPVAKL